MMGPGRLSRRQVAAALGGALASATVARATPTAPRTGLARGVNLSHWLAQSFEGTSPAHYAHFVEPSRLRQLAAAGFDHVRLCVDPTLLFSMQGDPAVDGKQRGYLHAALDKIDAAGLAAVVDLHPVGADKNVLLEQGGAGRFVANWTLLADALAPRSRKPALEILNEPSPLQGDVWWSLQGRALKAIRSADPAARVIVNGGNWSGVDDLVTRTPYDDANIAYTIHFYAPLLFTHQATTWSWNVATRVSGLGWPLAPDIAAQAAETSTRDDVAARFVREAVAADGFTRAAMTAKLAQLKGWQTRHKVPSIYVGEFGVYAKDAPPAARLAWLDASRRAFEASGWGWALWDMSPDFGFVRTVGGRQTIDGATLMALGLGT